MKIFALVVLLHFLEHIAQMIQLYLWHWSRPECLGILGLWLPWLVRSELLHYSLALYMVVGLAIYRQRYKNHWFNTAYYLQQFHHFEHLLLLTSLFFLGKPMSVGSLWFPRIELHFFYNLVVMIPMVLSLIKLRGVSLYR